MAPYFLTPTPTSTPPSPATVEHGPVALVVFISYPVLHSPGRVPPLCRLNNIPIQLLLLSKPIFVHPSFKPQLGSTAGRLSLIPFLCSLHVLFFAILIKYPCHGLVASCLFSDPLSKEKYKIVPALSSAPVKCCHVATVAASPWSPV